MRKSGWTFLIAATLAVAAPQQAASQQSRSQQRDIAFDWNDRALEATAHGDFAEAERLLDQAVQYWRPLGAAYDGHVATALYNKAEALCGEGRWRDSVPIFEEAAALMRKFAGPSHIRVIHYRNALANVYLVLGERSQAETLFTELLTVERELYPDSPETAHTLAGLSSSYAHAGRLGDALPLAEEALRVVINTRGEKDPETAMLYANVAQLHTLTGHTERSLPLFRKARAIFEATLGPAAARIGQVLSLEGQALLKEGKRALAEKDFQEAIERLDGCGACGLELAVAENCLAQIRFDQHKFGDADALLTKAMVLEESFSARPGREMATTLEILSKVRQQEKRFDDAARLHTRAQSILAYR